MTKAEAVAEFREYILPAVVAKYGRDDKHAIAQAWNDYTDYLQKERRITEKQYSTWVHPF